MNERRRRNGKCFSRFHNVGRNCAGETLIELLASMLVAALAVLILSGAISSGANVDARARNASKRDEAQFISQRVSAPTLSVRLIRSDGVAMVSSVSMSLQTVNGKELYRYDAP